MSYNLARDAVKEQVRQAVDIVELVGTYLELRREGKYFAARCPWHDDTRPSLKINPERQTWRCWVCNEGGDAFHFVMKRENVPFNEALQLLADRAGIPLSGPEARVAEGEPNHKPTLYRVLRWAEQQYHELLLQGSAADRARDYLTDRGISAQSMERFQLGYAPDAWQWLVDRARQARIALPVLEAAGLIGFSEKSQRHYDRFRDRLIFSIRDERQRPIASGGRILPGAADDAAKYINSPETLLFSKSQHLYGLDLARDAISRCRHAVVVEGYTDVIMAHQQGVNNVVAVLGTALTRQHVRLLIRFADRVTLVLDGDAAGQRRSHEVLELFVSEPIDLRVVTLPDGQDPCDFLRQRGGPAFEQQMERAPDALSYKVSVSLRGLDPLRDLHRSNLALENILETLARADSRPSEGGPWPLRVQQVLSELSRLFRLDRNHLEQRLQKLREARPAPREATGEPPRPSPPTPLHAWDRELLWLVFRHTELLDEAAAVIPSEHMSTPHAVALWQWLLDRREAGESLEFSQLLTATEIPERQRLLVEIDESAIPQPEDPHERLVELMAAYRGREVSSRCREQLTRLNDEGVAEEEKVSVLAEILRQQREKQGISGPTDG